MTGIAWGASEYLWSETALLLQQRGHIIGVNYQWQRRCPQRLAELQARGGKFFWRHGLVDQVQQKFTNTLPWEQRHRQWLRRFAPDFCLISAGSHTDNMSIGGVAHRLGIPFATLVHCANTSHWITEDTLEQHRQAYLNAQRCYFVSQENRDILEIHLAAKLPQAQVVDNPLQVTLTEPLPWPSSKVWQLACVARLGCWQKGQDLILDVLKQAKWRDRPLQVTFWGADQGNQSQLEDLVQLYGLQSQVKFGGFAQPETIWRQSHALLLPSRYEGMPMVTAEAMRCGRIAIVTACGRNPDWVDEGETGFLATAPTVDSLDQALERAWACRQRWPQMGHFAAQRIRDRYSPAPIPAFADALEALTQS
ncbi:MAG: glycosyltransferase family 4 protein [Leptolyngbya sp. SIO4C5]|nr:glycosyltransferase family 4 protein [Leptolyngbya sp. SIO4C5]